MAKRKLTVVIVNNGRDSITTSGFKLAADSEWTYQAPPSYPLMAMSSLQLVVNAKADGKDAEVSFRLGNGSGDLNVTAFNNGSAECWCDGSIPYYIRQEPNDTIRIEIR